MFKETLGAAVLGVTLASVPGAATAAPEDAAATSSAPSAAAATAAARRERLFVDIDTERVWRRRGHIEIKVSEADSRRRVRGVLACLHTKRWGRGGGGWESLGCERTDWRGEADWYVNLDRRSVYQIRIHRTWRYHSYRSDWFRVLNRGGWDNGRDRDNGWDRNNDMNGDRRR
ncbi:hypothetical protein [Actinocorallia aurantiaca]|uniref:Uncharacterized protein n=1 Tax=Actinocorallia aurantiaca TaxID=46204 RepID=A0ABN3TZ61_9ACTN